MARADDLAAPAPAAAAARSGSRAGRPGRGRRRPTPRPAPRRRRSRRCRRRRPGGPPHGRAWRSRAAGRTSAVLQAHVGALVARGRHRHAARSAAQLADGLDVVEVVVGHGDAADPAAIARVAEHALQVRLRERARIDHEARIAPDEPCVGAPQREGTRVVRGDEADVVHQRRRNPKAQRDRNPTAVTRGIMPACRRSTASARSTPPSSTSTAPRPRCMWAGRSSSRAVRPRCRRCAATSRGAWSTCRASAGASRAALGLGDQHWADDAGFDIARHVHAVTLAPPARPGRAARAGGSAAVRPARPRPSPVADVPRRRAARRRLGRRGPGPSRARRRDRRGRGGDAALRRRRPCPGAVHGRRAGRRRRRRRRRPRVAAFARGPPGGRRAGGPCDGRHRAPRRRPARRHAPARRAGPGHRAGPLGHQPPRGGLRGSRRWTARARPAAATARRSTTSCSPPPRSPSAARCAAAASAPPRSRCSCRSTSAARGEAGAMGNRISFVTVSLPVAVTDPIAVLRRVRAETQARKAGGGAAPLEALSEVAELLPGGARRVVARTAARAASFNAVVSNVPGPPVELDLLGRRVSAIFPAVPFLQRPRAVDRRALLPRPPALRRLRRRRGGARRGRRRPRPRGGLRRAARRPARRPTRRGAPAPCRAVSAPRSGRPAR